MSTLVAQFAKMRKQMQSMMGLTKMGQDGDMEGAMKEMMARQQAGAPAPGKARKGKKRNKKPVMPKARGFG